MNNVWITSIVWKWIFLSFQKALKRHHTIFCNIAPNGKTTCGLSKCAQLDFSWYFSYDTSGKSSGKNGEKENRHRHPNGNKHRHQAAQYLQPKQWKSKNPPVQSIFFRAAPHFLKIFNQKKYYMSTSMVKIMTHQFSNQWLQDPKIRIIVSNFFFQDEIKWFSSL